MNSQADKMLINKLGRYEIISELGNGSMGIIYKAVDPLIDRTVAIKTINFNLPGEEIDDFVERFNREAKSAGRLNHPNIVTIYDFGETDEIAFIAMEYLEGQELKEIIAAEKTMQPDRVAGIVAQVADALAFAHDNGVVHRDIKPANIMILRNDTVKIMDFGIAVTLSGSQKVAGTILGSPKYMSPEQVSGRPVDGRSDIFSLGAVLYEMLTGISVFGHGSSDTLTAIMCQVVNQIPESPTTINPKIPAAFDYIVSKALAKKPEDRYQSGREMADDLRNFKNLTIPMPSASAALPGGKPVSIHQNNGDANIFTGHVKKTSAISVWSLQKKMISVGIALLFLAAAIFFIYISVPKIDMQSLSANKGKVAGGLSKAQKNQESEASARANLEFTILPWGEIFIDGKRQGVSPPLKKIKIVPGKHLVEIKNSTFPPYRKTVKLEAGESIKIKYKFN